MLTTVIKYDINRTKRYEVKVRLPSSLFPSQKVLLYKGNHCYHFLLYFSKDSLCKERHIIFFSFFKTNVSFYLHTLYFFPLNVIWRSFHTYT